MELYSVFQGAEYLRLPLALEGYFGLIILSTASVFVCDPNRDLTSGT